MTRLLRAPLCIENGDLTLDATGVYDEFGALELIEINGKPRRIGTVKWALDVMGVDYPGWRADLTPDRVLELIDKAAFCG